MWSRRVNQVQTVAGAGLWIILHTGLQDYTNYYIKYYIYSVL